MKTAMRVFGLSIPFLLAGCLTIPPEYSEKESERTPAAALKRCFVYSKVVSTGKVLNISAGPSFIESKDVAGPEAADHIFSSLSLLQQQGACPSESASNPAICTIELHPLPGAHSIFVQVIEDGEKRFTDHFNEMPKAVEFASALKSHGQCTSVSLPE